MLDFDWTAYVDPGGNLVPLLASSRVVGDVTKCPTFEMYFEFIARAMQAFALWSLLVVPLCMFTLASSYEGGQHLDTRGGLTASCCSQ